ncbi:hypothetical protein CONPUDRAFT_164453 [Coniophora puteana RWD-64-598 SS2]|uniref:Uncharacterized protein n=1 Tax=Coniophora puteana (strain RWD-64-598) TaxID=741705 RepID=A0A5M3MXN4_CONPW|nr:uncharacterized protein CONPUDRAFT_164453 [Coniophora puteana RWD-64-598 SS2]EIW83534.1 hypothetical protein CONPUDRAFT_164453 [Coniophora puteana RWD-64-598 SS2]
MRPLSLHISALSNEEYDFYTTSFINLADVPDSDNPLKTTRYEDVHVGVREARGWMKGKYSDLRGSDIDAILKLFCPSMLSSNWLSGSQFFAALRIAVHLREGKAFDRELAFVQAHPKADNPKALPEASRVKKQPRTPRSSQPYLHARDASPDVIVIESSPSPSAAKAPHAPHAGEDHEDRASPTEPKAYDARPASTSPTLFPRTRRRMPPGSSPMPRELPKKRRGRQSNTDFRSMQPTQEQSFVNEGSSTTTQVSAAVPGAAHRNSRTHMKEGKEIMTDKPQSLPTDARRTISKPFIASNNSSKGMSKKRRRASSSSSSSSDSDFRPSSRPALEKRRGNHVKKPLVQMKWNGESDERCDACKKSGDQCWRVVERACNLCVQRKCACNLKKAMSGPRPRKVRL